MGWFTASDLNGKLVLIGADHPHLLKPLTTRAKQLQKCAKEWERLKGWIPNQTGKGQKDKGTQSDLLDEYGELLREQYKSVRKVVVTNHYDAKNARDATQKGRAGTFPYGRRKDTPGKSRSRAASRGSSKITASGGGTPSGRRRLIKRLVRTEAEMTD